MRARLLALPFVLAGMALQANDLRVCWLNDAGVDRDTLQQFEKELLSISQLSDISLQFSACSDPPADIRITIRTQSTVEPSALGAARTRNGRVLPDIELYSGAIRALMESNLPSFVGRAMARVAAHEIGHYLLQSHDHGAGVMASVFTGPRLMAADKKLFRIPTGLAR